MLLYRIILCFFAIGCVFFGFKNCSNYSAKKLDISKLDFQDGDIIFQTSVSSQSQAIQLATNSKYSHCGLVFYHQNKWQVLEAIQPVKYTAIDQWIKRGKNSDYILKRYKSKLNTSQRKQLRTQAESYLGKNYDLTFEWSDKKIYCSELVWKVYQKILKIELGKLQQLSDFDLNHPAVKKKMIERYGENIPLNESVISPKAVFESDELIEVLTQ
jgi:uncharacterized protein YycO